MKEMQELRDWLRSQKPRWDTIAKRAGISTKTISRFVADDDYSMNFKTFRALEAERARPLEAEQSTAVPLSTIQQA